MKKCISFLLFFAFTTTIYSQNWQAYVSAVQELGFTKATVINKKNYTTVASSSPKDISTAWMDGNRQINENQELLDNWKNPLKKTFAFYGTKFDIVKRDDTNGHWLVAAKGKAFVCAYQFKTVWCVVYGELKSKKSTGGFKNPMDAYNIIWTNVWNDLLDAGA